MVGDIPLTVLHVPGHTPADMAYIVGDAAFIGDTMFMPDYGSARADFPGGDARKLYQSVRRLMRLPDQTRVFLCHDYKAPNRSEEHTSELQSLMRISYAVFCLKKKTTNTHHSYTQNID